VCGWPRAEAERYWIAGGGDGSGFETIWKQLRAGLANDAQALRDGTYHCAGGSVMYLVSGRKQG
jgi:hypothetical protein